MKRRTLLGSAAMTLGGASVIGTGAFTSVKAERSLSVDVVGDADAFLQLMPGCSNNSNISSNNKPGEAENRSPLQSSDFVYHDDDSTLVVDLTAVEDSSTDKRGDISGDGIAENSLWRFPNAFAIQNQGTQTVSVDLQVNKGAQNEFPKITTDSEKIIEAGGEERVFNDGDPPVVFYPGTNDSNGNLFAPKELNPRSGIELPPSESQCIGFNVRTFGTDSDEFDNAKLVIKADADVEASNPPQPGLNVHIDKKSTTDGKLSLSGTIKNNAPSSKNIDVALEVQGANIDPDKQTIHAVSDGSETDFSFRNVDVSDLAPDNYTVVVTATTNGVAPVSDSAKFDVTASADSIELVVGSVGTSDSRLEFEIKNQGSQTVITGIRFDNSSTNVVRVLSGASDEKSEVAFINNDGEEPKPGISLANSSKQYSLFFFNTGPDGGFKRISGNQSTPSETNGFYPFKEDVTGWKSNNNQINAGKPKLNSGSTTVINIGEFRSGQGTGNRKVDLSNKNVTLTLKFGDGSKKQFEFINIPQKE